MATVPRKPNQMLAHIQPQDNPIKKPLQTPDLNRTDDFPIDTQNPGTKDPLKGGEEQKDVKEALLDLSAASNDAPMTNIEKKIRRAERFGVPVQLSEEEKRKSRAERFGFGANSHGSDALKNSEEQKRRARAERFGLPVDSAPDEEAKKKARLARFASVSKTDAAEEDKRKARAIRFQTPSSLSDVNGKENIKMTAIAGKASGGS